MNSSQTVISADELRHALGHFATGVTVVTSIDEGGDPVGTTASAVTSLSADPALLLVCLDRSSTTLEALRGYGAFAVNVLADGQDALSTNFARTGAQASWEDVAFAPGAREVPVLDGVLAAIECAVEQVLDGGDHEIVIGRVQGAATSEDPAAPLLHWRGSYARLEAA